MGAWAGFPDPKNNDSPTLKIQVGGQLKTLEFDALIDTGFSGFILMSMFDAIPLGLMLDGTMTVTLADGNGYVKVTAEGTITVDGEGVADF